MGVLRDRDQNIKEISTRQVIAKTMTVTCSGKYIDKKEYQAFMIMYLRSILAVSTMSKADINIGGNIYLKPNFT